MARIPVFSKEDYYEKKMRTAHNNENVLSAKSAGNNKLSKESSVEKETKAEKEKRKSRDGKLKKTTRHVANFNLRPGLLSPLFYPFALSY